MRYLIVVVLSLILGACSISPPEIAVSPVRKTLKEAIKLGYSSNVDSVNVEVAVAYGNSAGVTIPVALPVSFGFTSDGSTKMKFTINLDDKNAKMNRLQSVNALLQSLDKDINGKSLGYTVDAIYIYDPTTSELTELTDSP